MDNTHENPVAGIRSWRADKRGLRALHRNVPWQREMRSECVHEHTEPDFGCQCGLWARYSLEGWEACEGMLFYSDYVVVGVVSSAGCEIIRGETGFRAGEMRIEALIAYRCEVEALGSTISLLPALQALADRIGVPVVAPGEIDMFCALEGYELLPSLVGETPISVEGAAPNGWGSGGLVNNSVIASSTFSQALAETARASRQATQSLVMVNKKIASGQVIQDKKNKKPMYEDLYKRKGLDQSR